MGVINWNVAQESRRGGGRYIPNKAGRLYFRDGTGSTKSANYRISFHHVSAPPQFRRDCLISMGSDGDSIFITTSPRNGSSKFSMSCKSKVSKWHSVDGKDLVEKMIKISTGITPKGDLDATFDLKPIGDNVWKVIDFKIL